MSLVSKVFPTLKLGAKLGLVGAAVYGSVNFGIWQTDTTQSATRIKNFTATVDDKLGGEYFTKVGLPSSNTLVNKWNSGVSTAFNAAANMPDSFSRRYNQAKNYVKDIGK